MAQRLEGWHALLLFFSPWGPLPVASFWSLLCGHACTSQAAASHNPPLALPVCSEAACLDPQARMLLEHTHELLASPASAGAAAAVGSSVGVYLGCMYTGAGLAAHRDLWMGTWDV